SDSWGPPALEHARVCHVRDGVIDQSDRALRAGPVPTAAADSANVAVSAGPAGHPAAGKAAWVTIRSTFGAVPPLTRRLFNREKLAALAVRLAVLVMLSHRPGRHLFRTAAVPPRLLSFLLDMFIHPLLLGRGAAHMFLGLVAMMILQLMASRPHSG